MDEKTSEARSVRRRRLIRFAPIFIVVLALIIAGAAASRPSSSRAPAAARWPLWFEPNQGQAAAGTLFLARAPRFTVLLDGAAAATYAIPSSVPQAIDRIRMVPEGARGGMQALGERALSSSTHFYRGPGRDRWPLAIANYARVRYPEVYPGIDILWQSERGEIEYQVNVKPGADPARARFRWEGIRGASLDRSGDLIIETSGGRLRQRCPVAYQERNGERHPVRAAYRIEGEIVGFALGPYDPALDLVIDPQLEFSSYLGGNGFDAAYGVAADASGNVYLTGETASSDFPGAPGVYRATRDAFVSKINSTLTTVYYTTILASSGNDAGRAIAVDATGTVYVAGSAGGQEFPVSNGAVQPLFGGGTDAFIAHLDATGRILYSTFLGAGGSDVATGIAIDVSGNAYVSGYTNSARFPTTANVPQTAYKGGLSDAFVAKLNPTGSALLYSTLLGGSGTDIARAIAVDPAGEACIAGYSDSVNLPVVGAIQSAQGGGGDAIVGCLNTSGTAWKYLTYLGGSSTDDAYALALDSTGNAFVAGATLSSNFPTTAGVLQPANNGSYDAFVAKIGASGGTLVYSTLLGGSATDTASAILVDAAGQAWVAGFTNSCDFPVQNAWQSACQGSYDAFVSLIAANGVSLRASSYLGGSGDDRATALAIDGAGNIFVTGYTASLDFPTTPGALETIAPLPYNAFVAHILADPLPTPTPPATPTPIKTPTATPTRTATATVTATSTATAPIPVSVTPSSGSGLTQVFSAAVSDQQGASDIAWVYLLIAPNSSGLNSCLAAYSPATATFMLANNAATAWTSLPGPSSSVFNSQCTLNGSGSTASSSGNQVTVKFSFTFNSSFARAQKLFVKGTGATQKSSGFMPLGIWTVP